MDGISIARTLESHRHVNADIHEWQQLSFA